MRAIDSWDLTAFKATSWQQIAGLLLERKNAGASLDDLTRDGFALVGSSAPAATDRQHVATELEKLRAEGPVVLNLPADSVEMMWTLRTVALALEAQLRDQYLLRGDAWYRALTQGLGAPLGK